MALVLWNPTRDLMRMREEMNRLSQEFFGGGDGEERTWGQGIWMPPVDIYETEDAFVLEVELPGVSKEDVDIELQENRLTIRGERKPRTEAKEEQYRRRERAYGRFERSFLLPAMIDHDKVTASFRDGVLELRLPKSEAAKPKRIAIAEAAGAPAGR